MAKLPSLYNGPDHQPVDARPRRLDEHFGLDALDSGHVRFLQRKAHMCRQPRKPLAA